jgi:hypothetical protein
MRPPGIGTLPDWLHKGTCRLSSGLRETRKGRTDVAHAAMSAAVGPFSFFRPTLDYLSLIRCLDHRRKARSWRWLSNGAWTAPPELDWFLISDIGERIARTSASG